MANKNYTSLFLWIVALIAVGATIGSLTDTGDSTWYNTLQRSPLTPPNFIFPIAWTILYAMIAASGWLIWSNAYTIKLKRLFIFQLILNWSWTPLFFHYHLPGLSLICLILIDISVITIIYMGYTRIKLISLLMTPYLLWLLFATYLNFYIWQFN